MSRYAWVITQDLNNPYGEHAALPEYQSARAVVAGPSTRVGVSGPSAATDEEILLALNTGAFFRLLDDDGNPYYIGRCWSEAGPGSAQMFGPLDDYGRADVGATSIKYRQGGGWETL